MKEMKKTLIATLSLLLCSTLLAQNNPVLLNIAGEEIRKDEFLYNYTKNNSDVKYDKASLDAYTDMFVKFKLKVADAKSEGLDTIPRLQNELKGYVEKSAEKYLTDPSATDELIKEAYERKKIEINASHILIMEGNAYEKALEARKEIMNGADFETVALKYSQDPSVQENKGELGYFTAFQMVYPFEDAAYNTPVGEVSMPVKTRFGYHLIKVNDKRPNPGKVQVAHIYTKVPADADAQIKANAEAKIKDIYQELLSGKRDFATLAKEYSDDNTSANKGGELPVFGTGRMVPEFEKVSFSLAKNGDISEPFRTSYGWHIVKKIKSEPIGSFEEMKSEILSNIKRGDRSGKTKEHFVNKLKKEYQYKDKSSKWIKNSFSEEVIGRLKADDSKVAFKFKKVPGFLKPSTKVRVAEFRNYLSSHLPANQLDVESNYKEFTNEYFYSYEKSQLFTKYPEYKSLVKEFEDGILLFEISDQKVWTKSSKDTLGLEKFFESTQNNYQWKKRVDVEIYSSAKKDIIQETYALAKDSGLSSQEILMSGNQASQLDLTAKEGKIEIDGNELLSQFPIVEGLSELKLIDGKFVFLKIKEILPPQNKELKEVRGKVISEFQKHLESEWLQSLSEKYNVTINKEEIYKLKPIKK